MLRVFPHTITHWPNNGPDGVGGIDWGTPQVHQEGGLWSDSTKLFRDAEGRETSSEAVVDLAFDVEAEDMIAQGDQSGFTDPNMAPNAKQVKRFDKVPSIRNLQYERIAYC
jgi:hypothetical protein